MSDGGPRPPPLEYRRTTPRPWSPMEEAAYRFAMNTVVAALVLGISLAPCVFGWLFL